MDTGEVWAIRYEALLAACTGQPALLTVLHEAMSREMARDRALSRLARCQLIRFADKGRRDIHIPEVDALADFVQRSLVPQEPQEGL